MKKYSTLALKDMQIRTTVSYYISITMAIIKKKVAVPNRGKDGENLDYLYIAEWYSHSGKQSGSFLKNQKTKRVRGCLGGSVS